MKNFILYTSVLFLLGIGSFYSQVGINTDTPDPSAILDLGPGNRGLLVPRIPLQGLTDVTTIPNPANGLLEYSTAKSANGEVFENAFYYYLKDNASWANIVGTKTAQDIIDNLKIPAFAGSIYKTNSQTFTNLDGKALNLIKFDQVEKNFTAKLLEQVSPTTFKVLNSGNYIMEGFINWTFTNTSVTYWTVAIQINPTSDADVAVPSTFTFGMRCPFNAYESKGGFFSSCPFSGAFYLEKDTTFRIVALRKNSQVPTAGKTGDGTNYAVGLKILYFPL